LNLSDALPSILSTLAGVIVGFLLAQLSQWWKDNRRSLRIKRSLLAELKAVHITVSKAANEAAKTGGHTFAISVYEFPFITATYDAMRPELAGLLGIDTWRKVQEAYRFVPRLNEPVMQPDGGTNNYGYIRTIGTDSYIYMSPDLYALKIDALVGEAIQALEEELDC
jgi:hypothetical protein